MANDRIFLRCPKCKDVEKLFSYYPSFNVGPEYQDNRHWAMGMWMEKHLRDCGEVFEADLADVGPFFTLCTESPEVMDHLFNVQIPRQEKSA